MRNASKITTELAVDDPVEQSADFEFGADDRQKIDLQIRGVQQHLVDALIGGRHGTYMRLAASSEAVQPGDTVCMASVAGQVTKSTAVALGSARQGFGVVIYGAAPGAMVFVAFGGSLPPAITGLAANAHGFLRINTTTSRLERVDPLGLSDYGMGSVANDGYATIAPLYNPGGNAATSNSSLAQASVELLTEDNVTTPIGDPIPLPTNSKVRVDVEVEAVEAGSDRTKTFAIRRHFRNKSGSITAPAQVELIPAAENEIDGPFNVSVAIAYTGTTARTEVTGEAASTTRWRMDRQVVTVLAPDAGEEPPPEDFDPLTLPETSATPIAWIDADAAYLTGEEGDAVTAVTNRVPGGATLTIDTGDSPAWTEENPDYADGPTVDIVSGSGIKMTGHGLTTGPFSVLFVADGQDTFWLYDSGGSYLINCGGGSGDKLQFCSDAGTLLIGDLAKSGVPGVYIFVFNGASSKVYESKLTPKSGDTGTPGTVGATVGLAAAYNTSGPGLNGSFRHLMVFDGALSQADCEYLLNGFGTESGLAIGG